MNDEVPQSIGQSTFSVMGVELVAHVLDDGQRIIEAEGMHRLFEAMAGGPMSEADAAELARAVKGNHT